MLLDPDEGVAVLEPLGVTPLLEVDDEVRRAHGLRMASSENNVGALAGQRNSGRVSWWDLFNQMVDNN
jgi:hypothetical protein